LVVGVHGRTLQVQAHAAPSGSNTRERIYRAPTGAPASPADGAGAPAPWSAWMCSRS
jgi:hypothetical protein